MEILYLSSLCSKKEYEKMFATYGTISSHASQKFHRSLVRGLIENEINVVTLSCRVISGPLNWDLIKTPETEENIVYNYLPQIKNRKLNRIYAIIQTVRFLKRWSRQHKEMVVCNDIINGEFSIAIFLFSILHECNKIAVVTDVPTIRAVEHRKGIRALPIRLKNLLIKQYDAYVFLTEKMNEILNQQHKPYVIIEGIVDTTVLSSTNSFNDKYPEKVCMMAGLLEKEFGVDLLLEAFHTLPFANIKLNFYGKGASVSTIKEYESKDSRIHYYGEMLNSRILEEERKSTLLINPRPPVGEWIEYSFPSKNIEYISSGTPLVAYNLQCMPEEYLEHFYVIENNDILGTLEKLLKLDRSILHEFGIKSQRWILNEKSPKMQTSKLAKLIKEMMQ